MSDALAIPTPSGVDLDAHHAAWASASAKPRAAAAARDYDHDALWSLCLAYLAERDDISRHTCATYRYGVRIYTEWAHQEGVALLRPERGAGGRFRYHLTRRYQNPGTINTRLSGARVLYRALDWTGLETHDPFTHVTTVRDGRSPDAMRPAYTHRDVAAMLGVIDNSCDRAMVLLGADAGLRAAEMLSLDWSHVRLPDQKAGGGWTDAGEMLVHGKGGKVSHVPIGDELADALVRLPHRDGPVLAHVRSASGLRYRIARLAARAGIIAHARPEGGRGGAALGLHRLRHRFGTDVVAAHGLAVGQAALRHSNPATTSRYVKDRDVAVAAFVRTLRRS